jgi:hypothetical protein
MAMPQPIMPWLQQQQGTDQFSPASFGIAGRGLGGGGSQRSAWNPMQNPAMLNYLNRQTGDPNFLNIIDAGIGEEDEYWRELKKKQGGWRWTNPPQPSWWL